MKTFVRANCTKSSTATGCGVLPAGTPSQIKTWIDRELAGGEFREVRLNKRFRKLFEQLSEGTGESIPLVCQDWANTKAAYRSLSRPCEL